MEQSNICIDCKEYQNDSKSASIISTKNESVTLRKSKESVTTNSTSDDELSDICLGKFIALNPLYYIDDEEEIEEETKGYGFSKEFSENYIKCNS